MSLIVGIDPGVNTGFATLLDGAVIELETIHPVDIYDMLFKLQPARVVFEDSRLTSYLFTTNPRAAVAKNMARKVGQVDMVCGLIVEVCARLGFAAHGISPKGKGAKLNAEKFAAATGWAGASNEHTRDACMVAWPYREAVS